MELGEIFIATTWAASTSYVPFHPGMANAHDYRYLRTRGNRGIYATTCYVQGRIAMSADGGLNVEFLVGETTVYPGRMNTAKVRKIKSLLSSPNRSGIQVNKQLRRGDKVIFRYVAQGGLVRP